MLIDCINDALSKGIFPDSFNFANITPVHKKDEATDKENCRPVIYFQKSLKKSFMINIWENT